MGEEDGFRRECHGAGDKVHEQGVGRKRPTTATRAGFTRRQVQTQTDIDARHPVRPGYMDDVYMDMYSQLIRLVQAQAQGHGWSGVSRPDRRVFQATKQCLSAHAWPQGEAQWTHGEDVSAVAAVAADSRGRHWWPGASWRALLLHHVASSCCQQLSVPHVRLLSFESAGSWVQLWILDTLTPHRQEVQSSSLEACRLRHACARVAPSLGSVLSLCRARAGRT